MRGVRFTHRDHRPARQARSAIAEERIVEAARGLLATRDVGELSLQEIARAAGVSHGTLYARFRTKAALLDCVHALHCREALEQTHAFCSPAGGDRMALPEYGTELIRGYTAHVVRHYPAVRTFLTVARTHRRIATRHRELVRTQYAVAEASVRRRLGVAPDSHEADACAVAIRLVTAAVRDTVGSGEPFPFTESLSDDAFARRLTQIALRCLPSDRSSFGGDPHGPVDGPPW